MKVLISVANPKQIEALWPAVFPFLKPAIEEDFFTSEAMLKQGLLDDKTLLFVAQVDDEIKGAAVVAVESVKSDIVNIVTLGGDDFAAWKDALNETLTAYAKIMKCSKIVALGRKGWEKLWPDFVPGKTLFCKEIT